MSVTIIIKTAYSTPRESLAGNKGASGQETGEKGRGKGNSRGKGWQ